MAIDPATTRHRMSAALASRLDPLLDLWEALGDQGPTFGSPAAGPPVECRSLYLLPLAKVLMGGLDGSQTHTAVYLDERLRYVDDGVGGKHRTAMLEPVMAEEFKRLSVMLASVDDLDAAAVEHELWDFHRPILEQKKSKARVLLVGDCVFVETRAFLTFLARQRGMPIDIRQVFFSAGQATASRNDAIVQELESYRPDIVGISLFTFEGVPPYSVAWRQAALPFVGHRALAVVGGLIDLLRQTIEDIRTVSDVPVAVHLPGGLPLDPFRRRLTLLPSHSRPQRKLLAELASRIRELAHATPNTLVVDERQLVAASGGIRWVAGSVFDAEEVPPGYFHTTRLGPVLAGAYESLVKDLIRLGKAKAIFVDFDNTLWRGVMAEGEVVQNEEIQTVLLELRNAGILLVALSKNDERSIRWDEMLLSRDDFVLCKIGWEPKPDSVADSISALDLAPTAFVLLDDNAVERALVCDNVPGVVGLDPNAPGTIRALRRWLDFPATTETDEARRRTTMYRESANRRAATRASHDYPSMMNTLKLKYSFRAAVTGDMPRLLELVQRTSQFNTTTVRHTTAEIEILLGSKRWAVYVASLKDRFGDLGVVALAIFDRDSRSVESFIMSCRAMGFGLELAVLRRLMDAEGVGTYRGRFVATERNSPASDLFARAGFRPEDAVTWTLAEGAVGPEIPGWLTGVG